MPHDDELAALAASASAIERSEEADANEAWRPMESPRSIEELVAEGLAAPIEGWDFSWFEGRASEERPPWGYSRLLAQKIEGAANVLDLQTGGGEVLAEALAQVQHRPERLAATESWPPNLEIARRNLRPFGGFVIKVADDARLPFDNASFDLVVSRHPVVVVWDEIARVLRPGGRYFSQQVGAGTVRELSEFMMGPHPIGRARSTQRAIERTEAAGLEVVDLREASLRTVFHDIGAVVHFLRKVIWIVPDFSVQKYWDRLTELHERIQREGPFVAHAKRFLIEARKPC
jgi:SAM-dependent methyltransferase